MKISEDVRKYAAEHGIVKEFPGAQFKQLDEDGWLDIAIGCDNIKDAQGGFPHNRLYVFHPSPVAADASPLKSSASITADSRRLPGMEEGSFHDIGGYPLLPTSASASMTERT